MVRVISDKDEQVGIISLQEALDLANDRDLDLVEVAPGAEPPVCRILDYCKFKYVQTKKEKEARKSQKTVSLREVRFKSGIDKHDLDAKIRVVGKLLDSGNKVKVSVMFRGRTIAHPDIGVSLLKTVVEATQETAKIDKAPAFEGRNLSIILAPGAKKEVKETTAVVQET